jgi:branched-subunit amino acid transport protein AzlD
MDFLPWFEWGEASWLGQFVRTSVWMFPVIEAIHLLGLSMLGGLMLIVDLRLLGVALRDQPIAVLSRGVQPWLVRSVVLMLSTGFLLFISEAVKCYHNQAFWVKMATLPVAIAFTFLVRQRFASRDGVVTSWRSRALALVSIGLWTTVSIGGRWIGFSS